MDVQRLVFPHIIDEDSQLLGDRGHGLADAPQVFGVGHQPLSLTGSTDTHQTHERGRGAVRLLFLRLTDPLP